MTSSQSKHDIPLFADIRNKLTVKTARLYRNQILEKMDNLVSAAAIFKSHENAFIDLKSKWYSYKAVSYTHLTLPTICSV